MALKSRDVAIAAIFAFIAWGLATGWMPTLRYIGYAFTTGFCCALLSIAALILLSSRRIPDHDSIREERAPRSAAFINPAVWKSDTAWLARRDSYNPVSLYPSSYIISNALDDLLDWLLRDFITSWYSNITRKPNFIYELDRAIRIALINLRNRVLPLDVVEIVVSRFVPIVTNHLKEFYEAERAIRGKNLNRNVTESEELDLAIAGRYRNGKLHPAASLAYSDLKLVQQEHLRKIVARLLPMILPENLIGSRVVSVLLREILACAVMAPVMQILSDPDVWNQLMEVYGRTMLQDRKTVRKLRAALDQHTSPNPKAAKPPRTFPRLSPHDDERKFERFVRAIRQCSNLSDARRFRSEVASQLKRESMMEDQDQNYLRRLETGKHLLDQRVGKLSAVGGVSHSRPPKPDFRNGQTRSRTMDASITEILRDASGLSYFMEYMDRQKLMTLVEFWIVVEGFRNPLEEDMVTDDGFSTSRPQWNDADRADLAQIYEAYLVKPELNVSEQSRDVVKSFLKAGKNATISDYLRARSVVLMAQSADLELMRERHFPNFKRSDLYYKYLTSDDSSTSTPKPPAKASKPPTVDSIPESSAKISAVSRLNARPHTRASGVGRNASFNNDPAVSSKVSELVSDQQSRRSFDADKSAPLFDDDFDNEVLSRSTQSIDSEPFNAERDFGNQDQMVEAMEAALNDILIDEKREDEPFKPLFEPFERNVSPAKQLDSPRSSGDFVRIEASSNEKERGRPNLASLGLVNTASRIGVFTDNDLFDDEEKFIEDEHADPEESADEKSLDDEIHQAAPGDLGLAEAITALSMDIERLLAQESIVDTLTRKAELTNNGAELRILGKSRSSLQREIRRKELQRQQYIVQESDNSLYGRANVEIKSVMVGKDADGQEFALYVIEVQRKAVENIPAASWAVARRYSEFHDLHQRLRNIYPAVRHLDFPRRRLMMKLQREFLHKRRVSLEYYLKELLRLPAVCSSRDLRAFLSQQAIISDPDTDRGGERRDIVSRIYNSVTDGMDEFLGNLPVLDQLSIAGQNLISAATSQFNTMALATGSAAEDGDEENNNNNNNTSSNTTAHSAEVHAELLAFENREVEPFIKPICDLFLETFELNRDHNWLRGRAVVVVLHQLLGGTVERKVRDAAHSLLAENVLLKSIELIKSTLWPPLPNPGSDSAPDTNTNNTNPNPNPRPLKRNWATRSAAEKNQSRREASVVLATLLPDLAGHVVGRANAQAASRRVFATVNNRRLNSHLVFSLLDELVGVLGGG